MNSTKPFKTILAITMVCSLAGYTPSVHTAKDNNEIQVDAQPNTPTIESPTSEALEGDNSMETRFGEWISTHTLEEKVAQMFIITLDQLTGYDTVTAAGEATKKAIGKIPVGGITYFMDNLIDEDQAREMLTNTKKYYEQQQLPVPFLAIDEEGGKVSRLVKIQTSHFRMLEIYGQLASREM